MFFCYLSYSTSCGLIRSQIINPKNPPIKTSRNTKTPDLSLSEASEAAHIAAKNQITNHKKIILTPLITIHNPINNQHVAYQMSFAIGIAYDSN